MKGSALFTVTWLAGRVRVSAGLPRGVIPADKIEYLSISYKDKAAPPVPPDPISAAEFDRWKAWLLAEGYVVGTQSN